MFKVVTQYRLQHISVHWQIKNEHNKQLAFGWLFVIALYTGLTSPNKDETAVYG